MIKYFLKGQQALQDLELTDDHDDKDRLRGYIVSSIVSFAYEKRFKFTRLQLKEIATDIKSLLPSENPEYYFTPAPPSVMQENLVLKNFPQKENFMMLTIIQSKRIRTSRRNRVPMRRLKKFKTQKNNQEVSS